MTSKQTPWGPSQSATEIAPGITFYSTAGHGGFHLADWRLEEMPAPLRKRDMGYCPANWFEEDCEAALVILAFRPHFPDYWPAPRWNSVEKTVEAYYPAQWAEYVAGGRGVSLHQAQA